MQNLNSALSGGEPSYAWDQYYYLADHPKASRARAVVIAMVAHLSLSGNKKLKNLFSGI